LIGSLIDPELIPGVGREVFEAVKVMALAVLEQHGVPVPEDV
jgi:hypothetical protein